MDEQRRRYSADRRAELDEATATAVAVVQGEGLEQVLRDQGIENFVSGGDTMNPSVADLLRAVEDAPADSVLLLPNNPNILLAAEQAAGLSSKRVRVVPSRTVVQGIAAALEYFPEGRSLDDLADSMRDRLGDVVTGEVCAASRDAELDGVAVRENQFMALQDRALVFAADSVEDALKGLLDRATTDESEIVTLYWGEPIDEPEAERLTESVTESYPDLEFELVQGGQLHYHFFVSIE
jgi:dihydroxyacetone kinase-like predicted kinase